MNRVAMYLFGIYPYRNTIITSDDELNIV